MRPVSVIHLHDKKKSYIKYIAGVQEKKYCTVLWNNTSVYCVNLCRFDWFNKQADWSIAEQDKVRRESQTENDGRKKCLESEESKAQKKLGMG